MVENQFPDKLDTGELSEEDLTKIDEETSKTSENSPKRLSKEEFYVPCISTGRKELPVGQCYNYSENVRTGSDGTVFLKTKIRD